MTGPGRRGALRRLAAGGIIAIALGATLSACGSNGTALAKQACTHVTLSISLLHRSEAPTDQSAQAAELKNRAYVELLNALPIAAQAANQDEQWQALMTTLSESNRVPEATLVDALTAQCRLADSSTFDQPPPPSSIPPPDVGTSR